MWPMETPPGPQLLCCGAMQAGNAAAKFMGLAPVSTVLAVEPDEAHLAAAKALARAVAQAGSLTRNDGSMLLL